MATGDLTDITARVRRWLPARWFPAQTVNADGSVPRVQAMAAGLSANLVAIYNSIQYAVRQTRLASSTDGFVDLFAYDYFGGDLPRLTGESDAAYIARIARELFRQRATRAALISVVQDNLGAAPVICEPWRPADCGGLDTPTSMGLDAAGALGHSRPLSIVFMTMPYPTNLVFAGMGALDEPTAAGLDEPTTIGLTDPTTYTSVGMSIAQLLAAINRTRAAGIQVVVMFTGSVNAGNPFILNESLLNSPAHI